MPAMGLADGRAESSDGGKVWNLFRMPFWQAGASSSAAAVSHRHVSHNRAARAAEGSDTQYPTSRVGSGRGSVSSVAKSLLPARRRLHLDPSSKLYLPYEPGKQVRSAIRIKNTSKSIVAFKFQTTSPKSCFMRPPGAILSPGEKIIATVFKFVEHPENNAKAVDQKANFKFKIVSLKVKEQMEYVPELFDEQKDQVYVEQILRAEFLNPERSSTQLDKMKRLLAEADAAVEVRKKPPEDSGPKILGEGLVIDEWKERRERYLVRQQIELVDSL
ncbi:vesicle-associated protein 4-2-like [Zingiber officinale]|uniref:MSP domain-containing protein n=1 Tax=Zingiber officinale TaxID=94328 RepID=A0A8J5HK80_ZINOF|nr:vesicle-associated protein 4-2-like [Zingiber officinale]KAG6520788.1 hypothetical protein ZIOFF_017848 [Zingiber officinale]